MDYVYYAIDPTDSLSHYGTKNMHWHERRYQNYDGTWTEEGKERRRKGLGQRVREYSINSTARKLKRNQDAAETSRANARNSLEIATQYKAKSARNLADRDLAKLEKEQYENKWTTKLIGASKYNLGQYDKRKEQAMKEYRENEAYRKNAEADALDWTVEADNYQTEANRLEKSYNKKVNKYIEKYGDIDLNELEKGNFVPAKSNDASQNKSTNAVQSKSTKAPDDFVEKAIDDMILVMNGDMSPNDFNSKYEGTGWKMTPNDLYDEVQSKDKKNGLSGMRWG